MKENKPQTTARAEIVAALARAGTKLRIAKECLPEFPREEKHYEALKNEVLGAMDECLVILEMVPQVKKNPKFAALSNTMTQFHDKVRADQDDAGEGSETGESTEKGHKRTK